MRRLRRRREPPTATRKRLRQGTASIYIRSPQFRRTGRKGTSPSIRRRLRRKARQNRIRRRFARAEEGRLSRLKRRGALCILSSPDASSGSLRPLRRATDDLYLRGGFSLKTPRGDAQDGFELLGLATIRIGEVNLVVESCRRKVKEERVFLGV